MSARSRRNPHIRNRSRTQINGRFVPVRGLTAFPNGENHTSCNLCDHQRHSRRVTTLQWLEIADEEVVTNPVPAKDALEEMAKNSK